MLKLRDSPSALTAAPLTSVLVVNGVQLIKSVEALARIHEAQLLTYLQLGGWKVGLLINFNVLVLKDGIWRRVLQFEG